MKNIINEKPNKKLIGRLKFTTKFVDLKDIKNKKVLDVGCGYGWFENYCLEEKVSEIFGTEISEADLKTAKNNIHNKKVRFLVAGALKLPFPDNYFDTVVAWEVIEHIPKNTENKMFKEVYRVLRKNGSFYLSTPYDSLISKYFDPAFWLVGHRHYSKENMIKLGEKNGFKISEIYLKGTFWSILNLNNMYFSKWILRRKPLFEKFFEKKENHAFLKDKKGIMGIFVKYEK